MRVDRSIIYGALIMKLRTSALIGIFLGHTFGWLLFASQALAAVSSTQILISELQTNGGTGHSGNEFIELYNPTDSDVGLEGWTIQYHSASNSDCVNGWSKSPKISLNVSSKIKAFGYYLIAATGYLSAADIRFTAGLSDSAGTIRLQRPDLATSDVLAWGASPCGVGVSAPAPTNGRSLERRPGQDSPQAGNGTNSGDNSQDFTLRTLPEPQSTMTATENPELIEPIVLAPIVYLPLKINELLIDPVSPAVDTHDEFVELQNPNTEPINIAGYSLKTPSSQFHLAPMILGPGQFVVITSANSTLSLTNDGGNLQVFDPAGSLVDESAPWPKAVPGASWASFPDGWSWTHKPTPESLNIFEAISDTTATSATPDPAAATPVASDINYLPLQITELLVDPISPQSDDKNEFVELFNANDEPVDVFGYVLKSGSNLGNSSTLDHHIIASHEYLSLYSSETGLPLSNSGSVVELSDPAGTLIGNPISYASAKSGQAWILSADGTWQWSLTPTPSAANILTLAVVATKTSPVPQAKVVKKIKSVTLPKPKIAKIQKVTGTKAKSAKASSTSAPIDTALHASSGRILILILLGLTICYVIYEFRYDLRHTYHRLRGHTKPRI